MVNYQTLFLAVSVVIISCHTAKADDLSVTYYDQEVKVIQNYDNGQLVSTQEVL
jgi:hypothetical protein